jgi:hypothetical protein
MKKFVKCKMTKVQPFMPDGEFALGCNYWASHSGVRMWEDWSPRVMTRDLDRLKKLKMNWLRVFPLWPVFQPITRHRTFANATAEIRLGEEALPSDGIGRFGLSVTALERFRFFADIAHERGFRLVVGLLTGWMSGGMFAPPALEGLNLITDPEAVLWETRFVSGFVRHFRNHEGIAAWELGNECNALAIVDRSQSALWMATISNAIRAADPDRPVLSGMHALTGETSGNWNLSDQGQWLDMMTPHPYPMFSEFSGLDALNSPRGILLAAAANRFSEDLSGKPSFVEEFGTLGPCLGSPQVSAEHVRGVLHTLWAHNGRGMFWWCNSDFGHLDKPPYSWFPFERELGLFDPAGKPRPFALEIQKFAGFIESLPVKSLPSRIIDVACLLTRDQEQWPVALSTFILGQQAGIDFSFHNLLEQSLPDATAYFLPSLKGAWSIEGRHWQELIGRVRDGATLYLSLDDAILDKFESTTGLRVESKQRRTSDLLVQFEGKTLQFPLAGRPGFTFSRGSKKLEILAKDSQGSPIFSEYKLGAGRVFVLGFAVERLLASLPGAFHGESDRGAWLFYRAIARSFQTGRKNGKVVSKESPNVALTEHPVNAGLRYLSLTNLSSEDESVTLKAVRGWRITSALAPRPVQQANDRQCWTVALEGAQSTFLEARKSTDSRRE